MEEFIQSGVLETGVLGSDFRDGNGVSGGGLGELSGVLLLILSDLGETLGDLAGANEGGDVRVVAEGEHVLAGGGLIPSGGSHAHGLADGEVGELELESNSVPGGVGRVSQSQLVGEFVELVNVSDSSVDVEVASGSLHLVEGAESVGGDGVVGSEVGGRPLLEVGEDGLLVLFEGGALARE